MKFQIEKCDATGEIRFEGSFNVRDLQRLPFDALDRALLGESLEGAPVSDYLLTLERIYRKHDELYGAQIEQRIEMIQDGGGA